MHLRAPSGLCMFILALFRETFRIQSDIPISPNPDTIYIGLGDRNKYEDAFRENGYIHDLMRCRTWHIAVVFGACAVRQLALPDREAPAFLT